MTIQEWDQAWRQLQEIMDSENGEESMFLVHEYAKVLVKHAPKELEYEGGVDLYHTSRFPKLAQELLTWRKVTMK